MTRNVELVEPQYHQEYFLKKSEQIFHDFVLQLHEEINIDATAMMTPLVDELCTLTSTFAESARDKEAMDAFRQTFGETVTKHEKFFDAQSTDSANQLYKLIFNVLHEILGLVTPPLPDNAQPYVNTTSTFFTTKNHNSAVLEIALEGNKNSSVMAY